MGTVIADMSMSLDGYVADRDDGVGDVFAWYGGEAEESMSERNARHAESVLKRTGAVLAGRRTSDLAHA